MPEEGARGSHARIWIGSKHNAVKRPVQPLFGQGYPLLRCTICKVSSETGGGPLLVHSSAMCPLYPVAQSAPPVEAVVPSIPYPAGRFILQSITNHSASLLGLCLVPGRGSAALAPKELIPANQRSCVCFPDAADFVTMRTSTHHMCVGARTYAVRIPEMSLGMQFTAPVVISVGCSEAPPPQRVQRSTVGGCDPLAS